MIIKPGLCLSVVSSNCSRRSEDVCKYPRMMEMIQEDGKTELVDDVYRASLAIMPQLSGAGMACDSVVSTNAPDCSLSMAETTPVWAMQLLHGQARLEGEMIGIKAEIGGIKAEIGGIKAEIGGIKAEIGGIKAEMGRMGERLTSLEAKQSEIITEVCRIGAVQDGLVKSMDRMNERQTNLEVGQSQIVEKVDRLWNGLTRQEALTRNVEIRRRNGSKNSTSISPLFKETGTDRMNILPQEGLLPDNKALMKNINDYQMSLIEEFYGDSLEILITDSLDEKRIKLSRFLGIRLFG